MCLPSFFFHYCQIAFFESFFPLSNYISAPRVLVKGRCPFLLATRGFSVRPSLYWRSLRACRHFSPGHAFYLGFPVRASPPPLSEAGWLVCTPPPLFHDRPRSSAALLPGQDQGFFSILPGQRWALSFITGRRTPFLCLVDFAFRVKLPPFIGIWRD